METDLVDLAHHALARDAFSIQDYAREHGMTYGQAKAEVVRLLSSGQIKELIRLGNTQRSARYVWT